MLRCKVGDLCVIVSDDFQENIGKFVTVVERANPADFFDYDGEEWICKPVSPIRAWADGEMPKTNFSIEDAAMKDSDLRPIRDQPGADETLSWKDVPQEVKA